MPVEFLQYRQTIVIKKGCGGSKLHYESLNNTVYSTNYFETYSPASEQHFDCLL